MDCNGRTNDPPCQLYILQHLFLSS